MVRGRATRAAVLSGDDLWGSRGGLGDGNDKTENGQRGKGETHLEVEVGMCEGGYFLI